MTTHLTEVCVLVSLMGAGLALDRPVGWRRWRSPRRLIGLTMVGCIVVVALLAGTWLGLGLAGAVLLAAVLAPTDPVLAGEVQVAEPADEPDAPVGGRGPLRPHLRGRPERRAGLPLHLRGRGAQRHRARAGRGSATGSASTWSGGWWPAWPSGSASGWLLGKLFFNAPVQPLRLADHAEGFVALAATFLTYGLAELVHGYGFVAVFVCACAIRAAERGHGYHRVLHSWVEQLERLLTVLILVLLGGALARGLLDALQLRDVLLVVAFLLVIRPGLGWLGMLGTGTGPRERAVIAFFGVRGIGSLFYISWALEHGEFAEPERLWAVVGADGGSPPWCCTA